jgi:hypothetical protein
VIVFIVNERLKTLLNNLVHLDDLGNHSFRRNLAIRQSIDDFFKIPESVCRTIELLEHIVST